MHIVKCYDKQTKKYVCENKNNNIHVGLIKKKKFKS